MPSSPHVAAAVSTAAATASWASDHAAWFTIGAACVAMLSGIAAFGFYCVSIYYKIKYAAKEKSVV